MKVAVLGSGSWGSALSVYLGRRGFKVFQWCREREVAESINSLRENRTYLPGITYPEGVYACTFVSEAVKGAELLLSVIPTQFTREFWERERELLRGRPLICASKGIETSSLETLSQVYLEVFGSRENYYILSGPTFALEVAKGLPAAAVLASENLTKALDLAKVLGSESFRLYGGDDVLGVELGGALKNVIAIATGISDGMGFGNNARAALITRGLHEIKRLGRALGAREETFYGLSGLGDLVLTCTGELSRNRRFGLSIGKGEGKVNGKFVVEGVYTVKAVYELSSKLGIDMPISKAVYQVIYKKRAPKEVIKELLNRPIKEEIL
ncbi:NAD(P)H-dependent glycerol-3-phosphate dehydrogenase [Thermovibrio sp.]